MVGIAAGNLHTLDIDVADVRREMPSFCSTRLMASDMLISEPAGAAESSGFPGVAGVSGICAGCSGRCTSRISPVRAAIV